jgi:hypothetical protein
MNRRDFLLLKVRADTRQVVLSCEELYMRFLDARLDGSAARLFQNLASDLRQTDAVQLCETSWLAEAELKRELDLLLTDFRARGGRVVAPPSAT